MPRTGGGDRGVSVAVDEMAGNPVGVETGGIAATGEAGPTAGCGSGKKERMVRLTASKNKTIPVA
jgi:hypothetical protein